MNVQMVKADGGADVEALAELAERIWGECYAEILSGEQIAYMVSNIQSAGAICRQMEQGYSYYFIRYRGENAGYLGVQRQGDRLFLSKLYLAKEFRSWGLSSVAVEFAESMCREGELRAICLTVNRYNTLARRIYEHLGFRVTGEAKADIGGGFVMDDFLMEKEVE